MLTLFWITFVNTYNKYFGEKPIQNSYLLSLIGCLLYIVCDIEIARLALVFLQA